MPEQDDVSTTTPTGTAVYKRQIFGGAPQRIRRATGAGEVVDTEEGNEHAFWFG
jgi:hypothetical protein